MDILKVTVVGQDLFKIVEEVMGLIGFNKPNRVKNGMLGNLKILTYEFDILEDEVIGMRKRLMEKMAEDYMRLMPLYMHGDWMRIVVMKPFKEQEIRI